MMNAQLCGHVVGAEWTNRWAHETSQEADHHRKPGQHSGKCLKQGFSLYQGPCLWEGLPA
jgi:hypothetical protein